MRVNYILIDFESVQPATLSRLKEEHFRVMLFLGANQAKVPVDVAIAMQQLGERASYIRINGTGHNALDFHIAFYIGQIAASTANAFFHIISKDTGFDPLIAHLKSQKILVSRSDSVDSMPLLRNGDIKDTDERADLYIKKLAQPKVTKPRTVKTLSSAILSFFQKELSNAEVKDIVSSLERRGFIRISSDKIDYRISAKSSA